MAKKAIISFLILIISTIMLFAQEQDTTIYLHEVCAGETGVKYAVHPSDTNNFFEWIVEGGDFDTTTDKIYNDSLAIINWEKSSEVVKYSLSVIEYTIFNDQLRCYGDTTSVDIGFKYRSAIILEGGKPDIELCVGDNYSIVAPEGFDNYFWTKIGDERPDTLNGKINEYNVGSTKEREIEVSVIGTKNECESEDMIRIRFKDYPDVSFSATPKDEIVNEEEDKLLNDSLEICDTDFEITASATPHFFNRQYEWSTGDIDATTSMSEVENDSLVYVTVSDPRSRSTCVSVDSIRIMSCIETVKIPSAFTPDDDGTNDTWEIEKIHRYPNAEIRVYDRNKVKVFESIGPYQPWDGRNQSGKLLSVDSYHYIIKLDDVTPVQTGYVTIIY